MNRIVSLLILLALAPAAFAATATVSWTAPTTLVGGTPIPATGPGALTGFRVEWGSCGGVGAFGTSAGNVSVGPTVASTTIPNLAIGTTYCYRVFAANSGGESVASNVASKLIPTPVPNPPVLSATITTAYTLMQRAGKTQIRWAVGTVELGAPCIDNLVRTAQGDFYEIDRSHVTLTRKVQSVIVTKCEWS